MMRCDLCREPVADEFLGLCAIHADRWRKYGNPHTMYQAEAAHRRKGRILCRWCNEPLRDHSVLDPCGK